MAARLATHLALLLSIPGPALAAETPAPPPPGDPVAGRELFVGARALVNGGPPCGACHGIAGQGLGVAASYGPDLGGTYESMGADVLTGMLDDIPFPSMTPVYAGRPLAPAERADLVAFLGAAGGRAPARESLWFPVHAGIVLAAALVLLAFAARRRTGSARRRLLARVSHTEVTR